MKQRRSSVSFSDPTTRPPRRSGTSLRTSEKLAEIAAALPAEGLTMRELIVLAGPDGLLLLTLLFNLPFLLPIPVPGLSTPFGLMVLLMGIGVALNRVPWIPGPLLKRPLSSLTVRTILERGSRIFRWIERFVRPRLSGLSRGPLVCMNGIAIALAGLLLALPIPIPGTNIPFAAAGTAMALGLLEKDGICVLASYLILAIVVAFAIWLVGAAHGLGVDLRQSWSGSAG